MFTQTSTFYAINPSDDSILALNIAIIHCHFERGGVTQVVENHLRFLSGQPNIERIFLISGDRIGGLSAQSLASATHLCIEAMDYDSILNPRGSLADRAGELATQITQALAAQGATADTCVLHWHNHSLGKNVAAPAAIAKLSDASWRLLLQVHDFAEDNRPENYSQIIDACDATTTEQVDTFLYPTVQQIHFASLTQADLQVFTELGMRPSQTHCLPNSVTAAATSVIDRDEALAVVRPVLQLPDDARWCVYPVRGIRRKNVGEFLLLSRWLPGNTFAGITLRPTTPVETRSYDRWRCLAETVAPRAVFDAGHHSEISFAQNLAASDHVLSTSVAEGFGMVFLEPWLSGRSVVARSLPTVAADFQAAGIEFPLLYDAIWIPGKRDWINACLNESHAANQRAWSTVPADFCPNVTINADCSVAEGGDGIDFARLTPQRQAETLSRLAVDSGFERDAKQMNDNLCARISEAADESTIHRNANRVREIYSTDFQGRHLVQTYHTVLASAVGTIKPSDQPHPSAVDCVNAVRSFFPCRTEEFVNE